MRQFYIAVLFWLTSCAMLVAECRPDRVELRGTWGSARFGVEVAQTPEELSRGLMHRRSMPAMSGMLFVYEQERPVHFWMRNTLIPLDMVFMSGDGVVQRIHENAVPLDETIIPGGDNIQYVLEINGGMAKRLGINPGSELRHPLIDPERAGWSCD